MRGELATWQLKAALQPHMRRLIRLFAQCTPSWAAESMLHCGAVLGMRRGDLGILWPSVSSTQGLRPVGQGSNCQLPRFENFENVPIHTAAACCLRLATRSISGQF